MKIRLDHALLAKGYVRSRSSAQDLIRRGAVRVGGVTVIKTGAAVDPAAAIEVLATERYVARGAGKLGAALDHFGFSPAGVRCLDVGASTGGFTQLLIERGAETVFAVDVGHGQLHPSLRADPRIVSLERVDARSLTLEHLERPVGAIVCDVSFISILKVLPSILPLASSGAWLVALVKPQFEVGRKFVGKGGVVKDKAAAAAAVGGVLACLAGAGWRVLGALPSPIVGQDGNEETLAAAILD